MFNKAKQITLHPEKKTKQYPVFHASYIAYIFRLVFHVFCSFLQ